MEKYSISKKKQKELYDLIHEDIMKARIACKTGLVDESSKIFVDNILAKICYKTADKAIVLFKITPNGKEHTTGYTG